VRIKPAALFTLVASLPVLLWLIGIYFATAHSVGGRNLGLDWHGFSAMFQDFRGIFMDTVWKWVPFQSHEMLLRYRLRFIIMGIGLAAVLALVLMAGRRLRNNSDDSHQSGMEIFTFFGLSSVMFLLVLLGTYLFTRPTIDVDNRMLLPLYVGSVMSFYAAFALWQAAWFRGSLRVLRIVPWLIAVLCVAWYFPQTRDKVTFYHAGDGLTAYRWNRSEIIQAVRALPDEQAVISNPWLLEYFPLQAAHPGRRLWDSAGRSGPIPFLQTGNRAGHLYRFPHPVPGQGWRRPG
jgi:hypothetical protein